MYKSLNRSKWRSPFRQDLRYQTEGRGPTFPEREGSGVSFSDVKKICCHSRLMLKIKDVYRLTSRVLSTSIWFPVANLPYRSSRPCSTKSKGYSVPNHVRKGTETVHTEWCVRLWRVSPEIGLVTPLGRLVSEPTT